MSSPGAGLRRPVMAMTAGVLTAALVVGVGVLLPTVPDPAAARVQVLQTGPTPALQAPAAAASSPARQAEPVAVSLPGLAVRSTLDPLQLLPGGELEAPSQWDVAGWYVNGPRPGEQGPAVIAGHVDGPDGPAVFWRLEELRPGDRIEVSRTDGSNVVFAVTRRLVVPKDHFPTAKVYGPTSGAELRLITCDGGFDRGSGHYLDNLVVFATQVGQ